MDKTYVICSKVPPLACGELGGGRDKGWVYLGVSKHKILASQPLSGSLAKILCHYFSIYGILLLSIALNGEENLDGKASASFTRSQ